MMVREALDFTSSYNTPLPVTATPTRMSKQHSKSSTVAGVGRPAGGSFPPDSTAKRCAAKLFRLLSPCLDPDGFLHICFLLEGGRCCQ